MKFPRIWRTLLSIPLAAILGSAIATIIYETAGGMLIDTIDELRIVVIVCLAATYFTLPGAALIAAMRHALLRKFRSPSVGEVVLVVFGGLVGAAIMGVPSLLESSVSAEDIPILVLIGGLYGAVTTLVLVILHRSFSQMDGPSRE